MFKLFKKKNVKKLETIFPTAKDMLKRTSNEWPTISSKEILQQMNKEAAKGNRYVNFFNSNISEQSYKELRQQGYYIDVSTCDDAPCFKVSW